MIKQLLELSVLKIGSDLYLQTDKLIIINRLGYFLYTELRNVGQCLKHVANFRQSDVYFADRGRLMDLF